MKTVDFSETIAASDLKGKRGRHLIELTKVCEGICHFFTIFFPGCVCFVLYWAKITVLIVHRIVLFWEPDRCFQDGGQENRRQVGTYFITI